MFWDTAPTRSGELQASFCPIFEACSDTRSEGSAVIWLGRTLDPPHCRLVHEGLLRKVDAVTIKVPDLDAGLAFYGDRLGHSLNWRNDEIGQAGLSVPDSDTEIVLTTQHGYEPNWLVDSTDDAAKELADAGGTILAEPFDIPVGRAAVIADPFGNVLVLVDLTKGRYTTDDTGEVTGIAQQP